MLSDSLPSLPSGEPSRPDNASAGPGWQVCGGDLQFVEMTLSPGADMVAEPGAMMFLEDGINPVTVLGDGTARAGLGRRLWRGFRRGMTGESMFSVVYTNTAPVPRVAAFAAPGVGRILGVDLDAIGGELICQKGAYMAGTRGVTLSIALQKRLRAGFFGGEGFIMQRLKGQGTVFIHASGALKTRDLGPGERLRVDSGCLVALQSSANFDIRYVGRLGTAVFGGEGAFFATVTGPGRVWLQSLPAERLAANLSVTAVRAQTKGFWGKVGILIAIATFVINIFIQIHKDENAGSADTAELVASTPSR